MKVYITFGQIHVHRVNGVTLDADCVACFNSQHDMRGPAREQIYELLEGKFHMTYYDELPEKVLQYYPRGVVEVDL